MNHLVDGLNQWVEEIAADETRSSIVPSTMSHVSGSLSIWD